VATAVREVVIVLVPFQNDVARWGSALGPEAYLRHGLEEALASAGWRVAAVESIALPRSERTRDTVANLGRIAAHTAARVAETLRHGRRVVVLEGDCTHAVGVLGGVRQALGGAGVVWYDAHGDLNTTATTETGLWGGMPFAVALGWDLHDWRLAAGLEPPVSPRAAALVGTSDLDPPEVEAVARSGLLHMPAQNLDPDALARALTDRRAAAPAWYVHVDLDVAGPEEAPGGLTPAPHWPARAALIAAAQRTGAVLRPAVVGLAAYNPGGDPSGRGARFGIDMARALLDEDGG
jgi:arginase